MEKERYFRVINSEQALEILKQTKRCNDNMVADAKEKLAFGEAFDVAIQAVDKQKPKTATFVKEVMGIMVFQCNTCGRQFFAKTNMAHYCVNCGQKLRSE